MSWSPSAAQSRRMFTPASPTKFQTPIIPASAATALPPEHLPAPARMIRNRSTNAPPFDSTHHPLRSEPAASVTAAGRKTDNVINVRSSDELLALLDRGASRSWREDHDSGLPRDTSHLRNSSRTDAAGRLNADNRLNANRRAMDMRTASSSVMRRLPQ